MICNKCGKEMNEKKYRYSEIFGDTVQGEGHYTGVPTVWLRFWGCNFNCQGFGQKDPTDPKTWVTEYADLDISGYKSMHELPILRFGCDSAYSWAKKFSHLAKQETAAEICDRLEDLLRNERNPDGKFIHPVSGQATHMAFTGGEPMMNQSAMVDIINEFKARGNVPPNVTVETNGTIPLRDNVRKLIFDNYANHPDIDEWFWSCSPKLSASGEPWEKAINPDILSAYNTCSKQGQLKYVVDGTEKSWDEVEKATKLYRAKGILWPVWIMPVGSAGDQQEEIQAEVCEETTRRGYNFAARVHSWLFGNRMGK